MRTIHEMNTKICIAETVSVNVFVDQWYCIYLCKFKISFHLWVNVYNLCGIQNHCDLHREGTVRRGQRSMEKTRSSGPHYPVGLELDSESGYHSNTTPYTEGCFIQGKEDISIHSRHIYIIIQNYFHTVRL